MTTATYADETIYIVKLTRVVQRGPVKYRPGGEIEMTGAFLKALIEEHGEEIVDYARA